MRQPALVGTAGANATVVLYDDTTALGTATADTNGVWTITAGASLADGYHTLTATQINSVGNTSVASAALVITISGTPPTVNSVVISDGPYALGTEITVEVTFSDDIIVAGTDSTLALTIGTTTRQATFVDAFG